MWSPALTRCTPCPTPTPFYLCSHPFLTLKYPPHWCLYFLPPSLHPLQSLLKILISCTSPRSMPRSWQFLTGKLSYWLLHLSGSRKNQLRAAGSTSRSGLPHIDLSPLNLLWIKKRHLRGIRKATSRWRPPRTSSLVLQSLGGRLISISRGPPTIQKKRSPFHVHNSASFWEARATLGHL